MLSNKLKKKLLDACRLEINRAEYFRGEVSGKFLFLRTQGPLLCWRLGKHTLRYSEHSTITLSSEVHLFCTIRVIVVWTNRTSVLTRPLPFCLSFHSAQRLSSGCLRGFLIYLSGHYTEMAVRLVVVKSVNRLNGWQYYNSNISVVFDDQMSADKPLVFTYLICFVATMCR